MSASRPDLIARRESEHHGNLETALLSALTAVAEAAAISLSAGIPVPVAEGRKIVSRHLSRLAPRFADHADEEGGDR